MVPNALVVAFDARVHFEPSTAAGIQGDYSRAGNLIIPIDDTTDAIDRPGWIVDGQQRAAAIRDARLDSFPVCVTAFIADTVMQQREQFILVNSTKPLPKGLIYELLPSTEARLSTLLERRRLPAHLAHRLNSEPDSPFKGMIATPTNPRGIVKDNSVMRSIEHSLSDGVLYRLRSSTQDGLEPDAMIETLKSFWHAVARVFPLGWGQPPKRSRLMHGVGIVSLGFLMDAIADRYRSEALVSAADFEVNLLPLQPVCRWTEGFWDFGPGMQRRWNELQNTSNDIHLLANHLLFHYRRSVGMPNQGGFGSRVSA
jgi:DGQHR domain-containing protein